MDITSARFLEALRASLQREQVAWEEELTEQEWVALFRMADAHNVLPMIYEAVYRCPSAQRLSPQFFAHFKRRTIQSVMLQTVKTSEFLRLFDHLKQAGVTPCVVKGIVCRSLYPNPDARASGDEDVLIPPEQFALCHQAMLDFGMAPVEPDKDLEAAYEVPYGKPGSPLCIELHKSLFPPDSAAYGDFNRYFANIHAHAIEAPVMGASVSTLPHTDHFFYLICHAFKHFLHSGFGLRQVCDIVLYANTYGQELDWERVLGQCREIQAELFTAALLEIGRKHLCFDPDRAAYPACWRQLQVDEGAMLEDLLDSGVYGDASMSRKHSSTMTLNAVAAEKQGKKAKPNVMKSIFPPASALEGRYPYLQTKPYLLPVAWVSRILKYRKETSQSDNNDAAESLKIGSQRVELLRQYGIIK